MLYNNKIVFMNINELIAIVKNKLEAKIIMQNLKIEDKSFLHKNHKSNEDGRFHLKLSIKSDELAKFSKIISTKRVYGILDTELKKYIHSIQILIN
jgi:BolA protein